MPCAGFSGASSGLKCCAQIYFRSVAVPDLEFAGRANLSTLLNHRLPCVGLQCFDLDSLPVTRSMHDEGLTCAAASSCQGARGVPLTDVEASDLGVSQPLLEASDCATCCSTPIMCQSLVAALLDC